jgi:hypothetical protein
VRDFLFSLSPEAPLAEIEVREEGRGKGPPRREENYMNARMMGVGLCVAALLTMGGANTFSGSNKTPRDIDTVDLCQHWVHSYEEQRPGDKDQIFRPAAFKKFAPSRFRMQYKFAKDGSCEWFYLSPDDAHRFKAGKWMLDPSDKTILRITKDGTTASFRITKLTRDILRLAPGEAKLNQPHP